MSRSRWDEPRRERGYVAPGEDSPAPERTEPARASAVAEVPRKAREGHPEDVWQALRGSAHSPSLWTSLGGGTTRAWRSLLERRPWQDDAVTVERAGRRLGRGVALRAGDVVTVGTPTWHHLTRWEVVPAFGGGLAVRLTGARWADGEWESA